MAASGFFSLIEKVVVTAAMPHLRHRVVRRQVSPELDDQIVMVKIRHQSAEYARELGAAVMWVLLTVVVHGTVLAWLDR
jgi:hypothetical protein